MAKIVVKCPTCGKIAETVSEFTLGNLRMLSYKCGHSEMVEGVRQTGDTLDIVSLDGKRLFPFQLVGAQFGEASNIRWLCADEMGLGKTVQALAVLKAHPEVTPFLWLCKSGLRPQATKEIIRWMGDDYIPQVVSSANERLLKGFKAYIVSIDLLRRFNGDKKKKKDYSNEPFKALSEAEVIEAMKKANPLIEDMKRCGVKSVVIDECQLIKNPESQRTKAVQDVCRVVEHIQALSGTPIKNNAMEYAPVLNILRPDKIPSAAYFQRTWVDSYWDGHKFKTGGIRDPFRFQEYTKDFIIRRTRAEVLPDLPKVFRAFQFCDLGEEVEQAYIDTVKDFQDFYNSSNGSSSFEREGNILAYLSKMRHLTGLAKVQPIVEFAEEFLQSTDRLLTIFVHHKDVGSMLYFKINALLKEMGIGPCQQITSEMCADERDNAAQEFLCGRSRVLVASTLASGEGLNLQACSDCIVAERQWNPANEEQAEGRFPRPGSTADKINATYFVAVGTVDEFFSELVEQKREIVGKTLDGQAVKWNQSSLVRELAEVLATKGGQKWGF